MPEFELWKVFTSLGIPGLALGVFYMLFRGFHWKFPPVPKKWVGPIIILFMLIVGGVTFYVLTLWVPQQVENQLKYKGELDNKISESSNQDQYKEHLNRAKSFYTGWLIIKIGSGESKQPVAHTAILKSCLSDLGISLEEPIESIFSKDTQGEALNDLLESIAGQLMIIDPNLVIYLQAGCNILIDAYRNDGKNILNIIHGLDIPDELKKTKDDKLLWVNEIHDHFVNMIMEYTNKSPKGQPLH